VTWMTAPYWIGNDSQNDKTLNVPGKKAKQAFYQLPNGEFESAWVPMYGWRANNDDTVDVITSIPCSNNSKPTKFDNGACQWLADVLKEYCQEDAKFYDGTSRIGKIDASTIRVWRERENENEDDWVQHAQFDVKGKTKTKNRPKTETYLVTDDMVQRVQPNKKTSQDTAKVKVAKNNCLVLKLMQFLTYFNRFEQLRDSARMGGTFWLDAKHTNFRKMLMSSKWTSSGGVTVDTSKSLSYIVDDKASNETREAIKSPSDVAQWNQILSTQGAVLHKDAPMTNTTNGDAVDADADVDADSSVGNDISSDNDVPSGADDDDIGDDTQDERSSAPKGADKNQAQAIIAAGAGGKSGCTVKYGTDLDDLTTVPGVTIAESSSVRRKGQFLVRGVSELNGVPFVYDAGTFRGVDKASKKNWVMKVSC
jgi:hypothetical protein